MIDQFKGDYRWLSNFWVEPLGFISAFGELVTSLEHAYQAAKAESREDRDAILRCETAGQAKRMGQKVVLREDWEDVKEMVMYTLLRRKFANPTLQEHLLGTGDQCLVEGNNWGDRYWGCEKVKTADWTPKQISMMDPKPERPDWDLPWWPPGAQPLEHEELWLGENRLGILLMQVRSELRDLRGL